MEGQKDTTAGRRADLLRLATRASVITASLLILVKFVAWLLTGSLSVLSSLVDSLLDVAASLINFFAVRYALMPADEEHRFGHGKAEYLAGLAQSTFIGGSALFLIMMSVDRLIHPQPLQKLGVGVGVMAFSIVATLVLIGIQRYVIRRTDSVAIRADSLHYLTDLLTNAAIVLALLLSGFGWSGFDPLFALGIAGYILYSAWQIGYESVQMLLDRELPEHIQSRILAIARAHDQVNGIHEMRTRQGGHTKFIQLHLVMNPDMTLAEAHRVADEVERAIRREFRDADVIIHQDPYDDQRPERSV
ncbi:MAG TPA: cation diffusion facilitator family transporter [Chromatiales bacterium]|nr:cation diffusion facilitator family transporter [Chromatiales bacterium]